MSVLIIKQTYTLNLFFQGCEINIDEIKREILAELSTTVKSYEKDDKCMKELDEHKAATAMLIENLTQNMLQTMSANIEGMDIKLEENYNKLREEIWSGRGKMKHINQKQASNGKY